MGNSGSGHNAYKNNPPQFNQYVQSLPREGRGRGSSTAAAQKYYNGGFKVLPERVPGQKLRLTDNGNLLQNGGTLSGRRLGGEAPETDVEFAQLMKRRSDIVKGSPKESYDDNSLGHHKGDNNSTMGKKYHSNPDLLNSHGIISGNPSGIQPSDQKKKKLQKKSKAPPPPQGYSEEDMMHPHSYEKESHGPAKEKKRPFAHFLKPSSKKSNEARKPSPTRQDFGPAGHQAADGPPSGSPPSSSINAEITSAKLNSRDKSVTYVLERRDYHSSSSSSVLNTSKVQNQIPTENANGDRRYVKSPDATKPPQSHSGYHAQLQGKLSDGVIQAQTIDRAEIRNKAFEIQKRVRSMDSLACSSDERDIYHQQQQQSSPLRNELQERFAKQSREIKSLDNLQSVVHNGKSGPLGRQPSNSSSLLSDRNRERPPWDRAQVRHRHPNDLDNGGPTRPMSMPYPREKDGHSSRDFLNRSDSNNRNAYYYGGGQRNQAAYSPNQRIKESFPGSLGRRENGDAKIHHQRTPSGSAMPSGQPRMLSEEQETRHRDQDGGHRLSNLEINKNFNQSQYNRNLDQFSKDKLRPMNSKEIIINTVREGDQASPKTRKEYHDKDAVSEHLQDAFFAKTKETRAGVIEYNRKLASGRHVRESSQIKSSDGDLSSEDEMDINMQLRPTLPKRLQSMPRFSPQQVWRSFSLDEVGVVDKCSEHSSDGEEGDVFEDRILRVARPVAPPRSNNEKSADSGISPGAGSPGPVPYDFDAVVIPEKCQPTSPPPPPPPLLTTKNLSLLQSPVCYPPEPLSSFVPKDGAHMSEQNNSSGNGRVPHHYDPAGKSAEDKKPLWTPEEDLASDFDAGSGDHQAANIPSWTAPNREMISTQPKLISRKDMFVSKKPTNGSLLLDKDGKYSDYSDAESKAVNGKSGKKSKGPKNGEPNSPQKYNSVRKLKRSLSGVLQGHVRVKSGEEAHTNLDDNWSLSRSLPNSLHNGHEGERTEKKQSPTPERGKQVASSPMGQQRLPRSESGPIYVTPKHSSEFVERQPFTDLEGRAFSRDRARAAIGAGTRYNRNGHIVYLPKYEAMEIIEENMDPTGMERRAYSDLGMGTKATNNRHTHNSPFKKPKKFTYQSTVRQNERKQLEQMLSQEVAVKEKQRAREMDLVNKVEEEFQKKRDREKADIRQQLRILSLESSQNEDLTNGYYESSRSLPREYPIYDDKERSSNNVVVEVRDKSSMNRNEHGHLSLPPLIIPPEDYDLTIPKDSTKLKLGSLPGRNSRDFVQPPQVKAYRKNDQMGDSPQSSGFFSGIGKWMRRQQRLEKHGDHVPSRQEPEGAPSTFGPSSLPLQDGDRLSPERSPKGPPSSMPSSPHHENRSNAIVGAKFSSGRMPDGQACQPPMPAVSPQQRKTIYSHLAEVAEKEEHLRLKQQQGRNHGDKDARTSVWISSDKSYPTPSPSKASDGRNVPNDRGYSDFYDVPYDSIGHPENRLDPNYGQKSRYDKLQSKSDDDMLDNYNRARRGAGHSALQREWNAGQRHSIAVDPSRDQWATGIIPPPRGFDEGRRQSRDSDFTSSNSYSTQNNGHGEPGWNRGVGRQDSYRESLEDEYRRRSIDPIPLTTHHRSLSFSHINSEGGSSNGRKPDNASPRPAVPPVQPFHPNKAYRPVAFQTANHGFSKWYG